jgi:uncharacterized protein (TIGR04255 family)
MPIPTSQRVIYQNNPLDEVICQVRFPPVLRIGMQPPVEFQEDVRCSYPLYEEKTADLDAAGVPPEIAKIISQGWPTSASRVHLFTSSDEKWIATLRHDALSLTAKHYERWEEFRDRFQDLVNTLIRHYGSPFYSRVGLRYKDVIRRAKLHLKDVPWADLLQPHIAGELACEEVRGEIDRAARQVGLRLATASGQVLVRHGLATDSEIKEECFLIDSDYFSTERTETNDVIRRLNEFNRQAGNLFRWCITKRLHEAMGPRPVE